MMRTGKPTGKSKGLPRSIMMQSLKGISILAAQTWRLLSSAETSDQEEEALAALWELQENQAAAIDAHAELADQIDAEIVALKARMAHLVQIHQAELNRLTIWRSRLDQTILQMNVSGLLATEAEGQSRRIRIKENPPSCQILDLEAVPTEYVKTKTVVERNPDKTAIKAAWTKGIPIPGTHVERKRKVIYEIAPTSLEVMKEVAAQPRKRT